ncbi:MAG: 2-oxoglutarate dehydrogenase complex dihydrolipoyllysine-residue succinyltransferase [Bdellovibrio sp.]
MSQEIKVPSIGESITEVTLASWLKGNGEYVEEGETLCEIESDKATVELPAPVSGTLTITVEAGTTLSIGAVIGSIAEGSSANAVAQKREEAQAPVVTVSAPLSGGDKNFPSPAAGKILAEKGINPANVSGSGKDGRITKSDALAAKTPSVSSVPAASKPVAPAAPVMTGERTVQREKMSRLRKTIADRLVQAKNTTAMLTTFNEVDMFEIMELRKKYKEAFEKKHGVSLGFMSLFTKACTLAAKNFPIVVSMIDGEEIVTPNYCDVGIAVSTPKGLVVPVVRNAESMSLAQIELEIKRLAAKGRDGKLTIDDMQGGNFTITNGGVFGSMLSTPILNIPQSAILGMHNIVERPVAFKGQVVIHPVMYLALSYDHRLIDGRDSVGFLKNVKELLEDPARMILDL